MKLGTHLSFDGFYNTLVDAEASGFTTYQFFIRNNRNMKARDYSDSDIAMFNERLVKSNIDSFIVHASYALNPASGYSDLQEKTFNIVKADMMVLNKLAGDIYYVIHPGAATDFTTQEALETLVKFIRDIHGFCGKVKLAVEFMAGQGTQVLCNLEQLAYVLQKCSHLSNFCICLDTCHMFGAGFEFAQVLAIFDIFNCVDKIGPIHLNGSKCPFASHLDRHARLMEGYIPFDKQLDFLSDVGKLCGKDFLCVLETPKETLYEDFLYLRDYLKN